MAAVGLGQRLQETTRRGKLLEDFVGIVLAAVIDDNEPGILISCCLYNWIPVLDELPDVVFFVVGWDYNI